MTLSEAISSFKLYYNHKTGEEAYGFLDKEIKRFLEDSQYALLADKSYGKNMQGPGIEANTRRIAELEYYTINSSLTTTGSADYFDYAFNLPTGDTGMLYYMRSKSKVDRSDYPEVTGGYFKNILIQHKYGDNMDSIGMKAHFLFPRVVIGDDRLYVKVDSFTTDVSKINLTYIRKPVSIFNLDLTGDLDVPGNMHDDLIQTAVGKALTPELTSESQYQAQQIQEEKNS